MELGLRTPPQHSQEVGWGDVLGLLDPLHCQTKSKFGLWVRVWEQEFLGNRDFKRQVKTYLGKDSKKN